MSKLETNLWRDLKAGDVISLWDIIADLWIKGDGLFGTSEALHHLFFKKVMLKHPQLKDIINNSGEAPITKAMTDRDGLDALQIFCDYFGLAVTAQLVRGNLTTYKNSERDIPPETVAAIIQAFRAEMSQKQFLMISNLDYWERIPFKGNAYSVMCSFPEIMFDLSEAFRCFAVGRYTACVFHLMRATELIVIEIAKKLGNKIVDVNGEGIPWGKLLGPINTKILDKKFKPNNKTQCLHII